MPVLAAALGLIAAPAAGAAIRFAEPNGNGPEPCVQADPCDIQVAVEAAPVVDNDEIVLLPGDYTLTNTLVIDDTIKVHGEQGQPRPRLLSTSVPVVQSGPDGDESLVSDLEIEKANSGVALQIFQSPMTVERVVVRSGGFAACSPASAGAVLRDSVCWQMGSGAAVEFNLNGTGPVVTARIRNVTAIASGPTGFGIRLSAGGGADIALDAKNVIANGPSADVQAEENGDPSTSAALTLASSNYATATTVGPDASVTPAGSATNQTAAPIFASAATGDFHELRGSPTIDGGAADDAAGSTDLDSAARTQGAAIDIGAFEFDGIAPETTIGKHPKKRSSKRRARFEFSADDPAASFECKLDKGDFAPCSSPFRSKVRRKRHRFAVRATDPTGNADATPATFKWKVKRKRRHG